MAKLLRADEVGGYVRLVRGEMHQTEFAQKLGILRQTLNYIESGIQRPPEYMLEKLGLRLMFRSLTDANLIVPAEEMHRHFEKLRAASGEGKEAFAARLGFTPQRLHNILTRPHSVKQKTVERLGFEHAYRVASPTAGTAMRASDLEPLVRRARRAVDDEAHAKKLVKLQQTLDKLELKLVNGVTAVPAPHRATKGEKA